MALISNKNNIALNSQFIDIIFFVTAVLVVLSPLLFVNALHNPSALPRSALLGLASSVFLLGFIWFIFKGEISFKITKASAVLLAFVLWASLSLLWSVHVPSSYIELVNLWSLFVVFLFSSQFQGGPQLKNTILLSVVAASIAAFIGLLQNWGVETVGLRYVLAMGSTFYFKTHATLYFDLIFPVSLALVLLAKKTHTKFIFSVMSGCILAYLMEAHARGAWLALASLAVFLSFFLLRPGDTRAIVSRRIRNNWGSVVLVFLIGVTVFIIPGQVEERWQQKTEKGMVFDNSTSVRLVNYRNALDLFIENPVTGVGSGAFWKGFREYMNNPTLNPNSSEQRYMYRLHNDLYQILIELGLIGGLLAVGFCYFSIRAGIIAIRSNDISDDEKIICFGLVLALFASGVHSLVDFPLHKPSSAIQFFLWLGLLVSFDKTKTITLDYLDKRIKIGITIILLFYVITVQMFYYQYLSGNHYFYKADVAFENGNCTEAIKYMDQSHSYFDLYMPSHLQRVDIYVQCEKSDEKLFNALNDELIWDDTQVQALLKRGDMYYQLSLYKRSLQDYSKVVSILPHRPLAAFKLAATKLALGDIQTAMMELKVIERDHPDFKPAKDLLQTLNTATKESTIPDNK